MSNRNRFDNAREVNRLLRLVGTDVVNFAGYVANGIMDGIGSCFRRFNSKRKTQYQVEPNRINLDVVQNVDNVELNQINLDVVPNFRNLRRNAGHQNGRNAGHQDGNHI